MSSYANHYGLGLSLLERLMKSLEYSRNDQLYSEGYNPVLVRILIYYNLIIRIGRKI